MKIILASTSAIRRKMLEEHGVMFEATSPNCDEDALKATISHLDIKNQALFLAKEKAKSISIIERDAYVIGSDQICSIGGETISKSKDADDAFASLKKLQGKTHSQNNGNAIYKNGECVWKHFERVELSMKALSDDEILEYIKKDNPVGCAGSYKFELNGKFLFEKIVGSEDGIKGFCARVAVEFLRGVA